MLLLTMDIEIKFNVRGSKFTLRDWCFAPPSAAKHNQERIIV